MLTPRLVLIDDTLCERAQPCNSSCSSTEPSSEESHLSGDESAEEYNK